MIVGLKSLSTALYQFAFSKHCYGIRRNAFSLLDSGSASQGLLLR